jgi:hypothetical protein
MSGGEGSDQAYEPPVEPKTKTERQLKQELEAVKQELEQKAERIAFLEVSIIDGTTNSVIKTVRLGVTPSDIAVNPNTNLIYVTNEGSNTLSLPF